MYRARERFALAPRLFSSKLLETWSTKRVAVLQMSKLIHEQDPSLRVPAVAMARQRAKERVITEEAQD
jgi:hypothetical protein